jgi:glycosyltransferase involved in cell wall biosynthesis
MTNPKVSIVMTVYNGEKYIAEAIESVKNQTFSDYELLIIDDGSTDGTAAAVSTFLSDKRIKYFYQTNKGVSAARNKGIAESHGNYIAFIDHDDVFLPEKIMKTVRFLEANDTYGMVYTDMFVVNENGGFISNWLDKKRFYGEGGIYLNLLNECFILPTAVLIRMAILRETGLFSEDIKSGEDIDLWLRIARRSKIGLIHEPLVKWRQHENNMSKKSKSNIPNYIKVFESQLLLNLNKNEQRAVFKELSQLYFDFALIKLGEGMLRQAENMFRKSLSYRMRFKAMLLWTMLIVRVFDSVLYKRFHGRYQS